MMNLKTRFLAFHPKNGKQDKIYIYNSEFTIFSSLTSPPPDLDYLTYINYTKNSAERTTSDFCYKFGENDKPSKTLDDELDHVKFEIVKMIPE